MAEQKATLVIEIEQDDGSFKKFNAKVVKQAKKTGDKAGEKAGKGFGKEFNKNAKKETDKGFDNLVSGFSDVKTKIAGVATALAGLFAGVTIDAAMKQSAAIKTLETNLGKLGVNVQKTSKDLQEYASQLQKTTTFGDEAVLAQLSFAQSMGASVEQSKQIVAAAADMATALNIDLNSAVRNISKTLGGYAGELGEVIPALKNLTQEQLRAGEGIDLLATQFEGFASDSAKTFGGALKQSKNAFGDVLEAFGEFTTKNPDVIQALKNTTDGFALLAETLRTLQGDSGGLAGVFNDIVSAITGKETAETLERDIQAFESKIKSIAPRLKVAQEELAEAVLQQQANASVRRDFFDVIGDAILGTDESNVAAAQERVNRLQAQIANFTSQINQAKEQAASDLALRETTGVGEFEAQLGVLEGLLPKPENEQQKLQELQMIATTFGMTQQQIQDAMRRTGMTQTEMAELSQANNATISKDFSKLGKALQVQAAKMKITFGQMAAASMNTFANGVSQSFVAFGQALANGENAMDAFAKSMFSMIGDIAIQLGTSYIAQGIAASANPLAPGSGGPLIATGASLAAVGGAIKALSGGGGGSAAPAVGGGGGGALGGTPVNDSPIGFDESVADEQEIERTAPDTKVQVTIQGDVLDSEESGLRIVDLINNAFDKQGVVINQGIA
jgi:hypothetical protein